MKKYALFILIVAFSIILTGCTKYICYDGTTQKNSLDCPILEVSEVSEENAGKYSDNYGYAVAQAKQHSYTRVNMYNKDANWFANTLFTDVKTGNINKVLLKINGQTGDVTCITGCEYFDPVVVPEPKPEVVVVDNSEVLVESNSEI